MRAGLKDIIKDVLAKIEDRRVIGLITYRHYAEELALYEKFGRCGFAISVVMTNGGGRTTYDMLVEVEKDFRSRGTGGTVRYVLSKEEGGKRTFSVVKARYRSKEEFLRYVDRVRRSFYKRIIRGLSEVSG